MLFVYSYVFISFTRVLVTVFHKLRKIPKLTSLQIIFNTKNIIIQEDKKRNLF